jgi:hypothetical protein
MSATARAPLFSLPDGSAGDQLNPFVALTPLKAEAKMMKLA